MALHPAELATQKSATAAWIAADPSALTLTPPGERVSDGAGGWQDWPGKPYPVTGRLVPQSDKVPVVATNEGTRAAPEYVLTLMPDDRLDKGARFSWRGKSWLVTQVHTSPEYILKGDVVEDG